MSKFYFTIIFFVIIGRSYPQQEIIFKHLNSRDGLSNNNVTAILQAKNGFIWFATDGGLNRYDGYSFEVFEHREENSATLSSNQCRALAEDKMGRIWVGTDNGLNCFYPENEQFQRFSLQNINSSSSTTTRINCLLFSKNNFLWVGTDYGLYEVDPSTNKITKFSTQLLTPDGKASTIINCIAEDYEGKLWIGLWWGGFKQINPITKEVTSYFSDSSIKYGIENNNALALYMDRENKLWIVNYMGGIKRFDIRTKKYLPVKGLEKVKDLGMLNQDLDGNIWIKANPGSVIVYNPKTETYITKTYEYGNSGSLSSGSISSIYCDKSGIVWLATDQDISYFTPSAKKFMPYYRHFNLNKRDFCKSFFQDSYNNVWISVWDVGLLKYNPQSGKHLLISHNSHDKQSITHNQIHGIYEDNQRNIWLATYNGISIINPQTNKLVRNFFYNGEKPTLLSNVVNANITGKKSSFFWSSTGDSLIIHNIATQRKWLFAQNGNMIPSNIEINCISIDRHNDLWIGTRKAGLYHFQNKIGEMERFISSSVNNKSISSNSINDIFEDHAGMLWIATQNGLNKYDPISKFFVRYTKMNGLSGNECFSVKEDKQHRLWIATSSGLDKFDVQAGTIINYNELDGIEISHSTIFQSEDGTLFGGNAERGFYMFHPDSIKDNKRKFPVYITEFYLFNESVPIKSDSYNSPLKRSVIYTNEITLTHTQSVFGFEFSELNYILTEKNRYAYKLEGFDKQWFQTDSKHRRVTYTNLNAGTYIFRVKAANNDGVWNEKQTMLKIIILPPWWKTWWAHSLYFIATLALLLFVRKYYIDKERLQHEIVIQKLKAQQTFDISQLEQRFFTNISHEFRTPLTLISGPIEKLIQSIDCFERNKFLELFQLIHRNAKRLTQLTNQILDFRKIESGKMKLEICSGDMVTHIRNIGLEFSSLVEKKQIDFQIITNDEINTTGNLWFDPDKTTKIFINLLSNAFEFTPENGKVTLRINFERNDEANCTYLIVSVEDTGIGISKENIEKIFSPFFQIENSHKHSNKGTGIGLALTKELVELLNGTIEVESELGKGSKFKVKLPVDKTLLGNYTILDANSVDNNVLNTSTLPADSLHSASNTKNVNIHQSQFSILLVEDNSDMRLFIHNILKNYYIVIEADNGLQGIRQATELIPDLIISDVMMPEIDGYELTNKLKTDIRTSHIPIILLTALTSTEHIIKGLENEADDYITKPFNEQILLLIVNNLISSRQKLKSLYSAHIINSYSKNKIELQPEKPEIPHCEKQFLDKLMAIIEKQMNNSDFNVQQFASEVGMEASVLHRKMKAILNQSPGGFIRSIRMKRAVQLFEHSNISINEVADLVGYGNNVNYFSTAFRKHFGKSPKEFQRSLFDNSQEI